MKDPSVAASLIYQRKLKGYSQQQLAEKTSVTVRTIQRIENGQVTPHLQTIKLLATALDVEVNELMPLDDPKQEAIQQKWLLIMHGAPLIGLVIPLLNILIPLFLWIHKRDDNKLYDVHGRAIINFHITVTIVFILAFIALLTIEGYGFVIFITFIPLAALVVVVNIISALKTRKCYYPAIPFIKRLSLVLLLITGVTTSQPLPAQNIGRLDGTIISADSLTTHLQHLSNQAKVQGLAVAVFNDHKLTYQQTFGYSNLREGTRLTDTTNLYGASLSKAVFSVLVLRLVEQGLIDLDTPLQEYLPKKIYHYTPQTRWHDNYADLEHDSLYHKITARMCLSHTTGFPNWRWFESDEKLKVKFDPGSRYGYSGEGYVYLQVVIEKLLDANLEAWAQELIFKPVQMQASSYQWQDRFAQNFAHGHNSHGEVYPKDIDNEPRGGSTLETTFEDYSIFLQSVLQGKLLSQNSWDEIFKPQIRIRSLRHFGPLSQVDTTLYDHLELSYGLGWGVLKTPFGKGCFKGGHGEGFQHYSIIFPESGTGVLIMSNSDNAESIFKEVLAVAIADTYTPWRWNNFIPYDD